MKHRRPLTGAFRSLMRAKNCNDSIHHIQRDGLLGRMPSLLNMRTALPLTMQRCPHGKSGSMELRCQKQGGELAMQEIGRMKHCLKNRIEAHIEQAVVAR